MTVRDTGQSGPLDVATLEVLARRAIVHRLVSDWEFRPDALSPRVLELQLDDTQYPERITDVRLDVRWFTGGDYTVHYLEQHKGGMWECRWDRHPKPDAPREHYHPPPSASSTVEQSSFESEHHLGLLFETLEWVEHRVAELYE